MLPRSLRRRPSSLTATRGGAGSGGSAESGMLRAFVRLQGSRSIMAIGIGIDVGSVSVKAALFSTSAGGCPSARAPLTRGRLPAGEVVEAGERPARLARRRPLHPHRRKPEEPGTRGARAHLRPGRPRGRRGRRGDGHGGPRPRRGAGPRDGGRVPDAQQGRRAAAAERADAVRDRRRELEVRALRAPRRQRPTRASPTTGPTATAPPAPARSWTSRPAVSGSASRTSGASRWPRNARRRSPGAAPCSPRAT